MIFMPFTIATSRPALPHAYGSGIWSLIIILRMCVAPAYAELVDVGGKVEDGITVYTVYIDTESIHRNGDIVSLWALYDYMTIQNIVGGP